MRAGVTDTPLDQTGGHACSIWVTFVETIRDQDLGRIYDPPPVIPVHS
jgi:hypothetical protein